MTQQTITKKNLDFEIQFYEGVLARRPDFIDALKALGDAYTKRGHYQAGLNVDLKLAHLLPQDSVVLYNLSCSYSLLNEVDLAFRFVKLAIKHGYRDFSHMKTDSDLANLHQDLRFKRFLARLTKKRETA